MIKNKIALGLYEPPHSLEIFTYLGNDVIQNIQKIKMDKIKKKIKEAKGTTIIIDKNNNSDSDSTEKESEETEEDIEKKFAELLKIFGKAAMELGEIFVKIAESDENE